MGLDAVISSAVEAVRIAVESLRVEVEHEEWLEQDALGKADFDVPVTRMAIVQEGRRQLQTLDGRSVVVRAFVTFYPEADGEAPPAVKVQDRITLPSGLVGTIIEIRDSMTNPATGAPYSRTLWLV